MPSSANPALRKEADGSFSCVGRELPNPPPMIGAYQEARGSARARVVKDRSFKLRREPWGFFCRAPLGPLPHSASLIPLRRLCMIRSLQDIISNFLSHTGSSVCTTLSLSAPVSSKSLFNRQLLDGGTNAASQAGTASRPPRPTSNSTLTRRSSSSRQRALLAAHGRGTASTLA